MARKFNLKPLPPIGITDTRKEGVRCFFPFFLCFFFVVVFSFLVLVEWAEDRAKEGSCWAGAVGGA